MRSKANIATHPLHPIFVAFPIAFLIGTLLFDVLGMWQEKEGMKLTALYLNVAGLIAGLIAAVPGFIDYLYTVPPNSSAKSRATKHGLINVGMLLVFGGALVYRQLPEHSIWLLLGIDVAGVVLISIAGWMGGTLVHRNQIGIDIRYAGAGKWNEKYLESKSGRVLIGSDRELQVNQMMLVHVHDKRIVIGRTEEGYVAFDDYCPHKGGSLVGGSMMCGTVQCPWHGSQFDVNNGDLKEGPSKIGIPVYGISYSGGKVYLELEEGQYQVVSPSPKRELKPPP